jgi:hypothetical protein
MSGITVPVRLGLAARPTQPMTPFTIVVLAIQASTSPPRLSTPPAHNALSSGRILARSRLWRSRMSFAPSCFSHADSLSFPVSAVTS